MVHKGEWGRNAVHKGEWEGMRCIKESERNAVHKGEWGGMRCIKERGEECGA